MVVVVAGVEIAVGRRGEVGWGSNQSSYWVEMEQHQAYKVIVAELGSDDADSDSDSDFDGMDVVVAVMSTDVDAPASTEAASIPVPLPGLQLPARRQDSQATPWESATPHPADSQPQVHHA